MKAGRDIGRRSKWRERRKSLCGERKAHKGSNGKRLPPLVDTQHQRHWKPSTKTSPLQLLLIFKIILLWANFTGSMALQTLHKHQLHQPLMGQWGRGATGLSYPRWRPHWGKYISLTRNTPPGKSLALEQPLEVIWGLKAGLHSRNASQYLPWTAV